MEGVIEGKKKKGLVEDKEIIIKIEEIGVIMMMLGVGLKF